MCQNRLVLLIFSFCFFYPTLVIFRAVLLAMISLPDISSNFRDFFFQLTRNFPKNVRKISYYFYFRKMRKKDWMKLACLFHPHSSISSMWALWNFLFLRFPLLEYPFSDFRFWGFPFPFPALVVTFNNIYFNNFFMLIIFMQINYMG